MRPVNPSSFKVHFLALATACCLSAMPTQSRGDVIGYYPFDEDASDLR